MDVQLLEHVNLLADKAIHGAGHHVISRPPVARARIACKCKQPGQFFASTAYMSRARR